MIILPSIIHAVPQSELQLALKFPLFIHAFSLQLHNTECSYEMCTLATAVLECFRFRSNVGLSSCSPGHRKERIELLFSCSSLICYLSLPPSAPVHKPGRPRDYSTVRKLYHCNGDSPTSSLNYIVTLGIIFSNTFSNDRTRLEIILYDQI